MADSSGDLPVEEPAAPETLVEASTTTQEEEEDPSLPTSPKMVKPAPLEHGFVAGDHVIRWEMLPIAWPIQIHGIVLNVSDAGIVLVDFGLAASHQQQQQQQPPPPANENPGDSEASSQPSSEPGGGGKRPSFFSVDGQKDMERKIQNSFKKLNPTHEKQRLNVLVLDDPNEIKSWRKVNYDGGLFGFGGEDSEKATLESEAAATHGKQNKLTKLWNSFSLKKSKPGEAGDPDDTATVDSTADDGSSTDGAAAPSSNSSSGGPARKAWWRRSSANDTTPTTITEEAADAVVDQDDNSNPPTEGPTLTTTDESTEEPSPASESPSTPTSAPPAAPEASPKRSPLSQRAMNPAMAKLLEGKKTEGGTNNPKKEEKKKVNLPKADPPKLVLARTRWLLQHGEDVLPPYHAFHSNSECIAVFCKTGYWSNLQADVFLHSTAIGNAKTMGAATIGVAASAPFLAPVIAGLGIGMVAAPWLFLHSSKQHQGNFTQQMTDQFWEQAENEVFVECIEHWSKLEEYYQAKEEQAAAAATSQKEEEEEEDLPAEEESHSPPPKVVNL